MDNVIIIGVGGAGCNIADSCRKECPKLHNAKYIYVDKDAMAIVNHGSEDECILLTEDKDINFCELLRGYKTVFVCAGLGGEIGSELSPKILEYAKAESLSTIIAVVSTPFSFEGVARNEKAQMALTRVNSIAHKVIVQDNNDIPQESMLPEMDRSICNMVNELLSK